MFVAGHHIIGYVIVFAVVVKHSEPEPGGHKPLCRVVDVFHIKLAELNRHIERFIGLAAVEMAAVFHGQRRGVGRVIDIFVIFPDIADSAAVRDHVSVKPELTEKDFPEQRFTCTAGLPAHAVVGPHYRRGVGVLYAVFEGAQVCVVKVKFTYFSVVAVPLGFGAAVDRVVFKRRVNLAVFTLALHTLDIFGGHDAG